MIGVKKISIQTAIRTNKIPFVKRFLEFGHRIEGWDCDSNSPFRYLVAVKSSLDMIKLLLTANYTFEGCEYVIYKRAMFCDRKDIMNMVDVPELGHMFSLDLQDLIANNCTDVVKSIVFQGSATKQHYLPVVRWAVVHGHWDVIEFVCERMVLTEVQLDNLLCACVQCGRMDMLNFFVAKGGNVDRNKDQMLQWAARFGQLPMTAFLLRQGANPGFERGKALRNAYTNNKWNVALLLANVLKRNIGTMKAMNKKTGYHSFILTLVNLLRGYARPKGCKEWRNDEYYDGNIGMIVCLYLD